MKNLSKLPFFVQLLTSLQDFSILDLSTIETYKSTDWERLLAQLQRMCVLSTSEFSD